MKTAKTQKTSNCSNCKYKDACGGSRFGHECEGYEPARKNKQR